MNKQAKKKVPVISGSGPPSLAMPIRVKPYRHQQAAFDFVCKVFGLMDGKKCSPGSALLMEMGTGKTLVAIATACILHQFGLAERVLVVAPFSLLGMWESELEKFAGVPVNVTVVRGTPEKKKRLIKEAASERLDIVIVNYESAWRLEKELLAYDADLIIADEAQAGAPAGSAWSADRTGFGRICDIL